MSMSDKYYRLVTLLVDISTKVLLTLFLDLAKKHSVPGVPYTTLQIYLSKRQSDIKKYVTRFQYNIIYSSSSTCDGSEWDISLLSSLLLGLFGAHVQPINGDIKAIKDIRNSMQHSANTATVSDGDFKSLWDNICTSTLAIAFHVKGNVYENEVKEKITLLSTSTFIPRQGESLRIWYTSYAENTASIFKEEIISLKETLQKNIEEHKQETLLLKTKILEHKGETVKLKEQIVEHRNETVGMRSKIVDQSSELAELKEKMVQLQKQSVDMETDCRTSSSILKCAAVKRTSCTGKVTKRFKTVSQAVERMLENFKKAMNAEQLEDVNLPDECAEIRRRIADDRFVVIAGHGKSSYIRTALYVVQESEKYNQEFCAMITDPTDWKHIEPEELKLVFFKCPFGEAEPNKEKTRAMLDILNNVQLTTKDSELVVIVVTQWEIMQEALNDVNGHHALLDEPVKLYRANNEHEPDVIDDGILNRTKGTKRTQIKTMQEMTKSYREKYNHFVNKEALKTVRMEMKKNKVVLISGDNHQTNTSVALHLANDYDERRFVIVQNKLDISNIDLDNISLLMVENIAGKYIYDVARLADWLETFDTLLALVEKGKLNLVATIESDKMEMGMNDLWHHPIFSHEVRVSSDSICVKKEIEMPFASVPTQVPTRQGNSLTPGAQNLNSPVNDIDNTDDEINDFTISSVPEFSQNHTTVANQAQASSHHGIPSLESVNVLNVGRLRLNRITILSETCLLVSSNDNMLHSYDRQQDIPTDKVTLKSTVGQLTAIDENQVAGTLPYTGNVVFINVSHTGVLTISKEIYVGEYCGGIAHSDGKLIISNDSGYKVSIMNMDGNIEITFSVKQEISRIASYNIYFAQLVLSPNHDTIYICDPINDTVTALTREGRVIGVVKKLNKLLCPRGMTVDSVGRVYECGLASDTVCLVSPENSNVTRLMGPENGVKRPVDVAFCKWTNSIYVLNLGRNIKVFKINDL